MFHHLLLGRTRPTHNRENDHSGSRLRFSQRDSGPHGRHGSSISARYRWWQEQEAPTTGTGTKGLAGLMAFPRNRFRMLTTWES
jgi:hypothetical protein